MGLDIKLDEPEGEAANHHDGKANQEIARRFV
jgi:hypothetical protein